MAAHIKKKRIMNITLIILSFFDMTTSHVAYYIYIIIFILLLSIAKGRFKKPEFKQKYKPCRLCDRRFQ